MTPLARARGALRLVSGGLAAALLGSAACVAPATAVVTAIGDGSVNTTPPVDDPGFANVGRASNSLTGVYLRNRWVLTAGHVGEPAWFAFDGKSYATQAGSRVLFETGPGQHADLALVRLVDEPPLPPVVLATSGPAVGDVVTLIGNGRDRAPTLTCWDDIFEPQSCGPGKPPAFTGYLTLDPRTLRWGRNQVTLVGSEVGFAGSGPTRCFETRFDEEGLPEEAQLVRGDSGGAAFLKRGSGWELAGILFAVVPEPGQPPDTAVFGNTSLMVDVAFYQPQIEDVVCPPLLIPIASAAALLAAAVAMVAWARRSLRRRRALRV